MKRSIFEKLKWKIIYWLARRLPDCKTITPSIGKLMDGKLSARQKFIAKLHLLTCDACALYAKQINFMREVYEEQEKYFQGEDFSLKLSTKAQKRIKTALRLTIVLGA